MVLASRAAASRSLDRGIIAAPEKIVFAKRSKPDRDRGESFPPAKREARSGEARRAKLCRGERRAAVTRAPEARSVPTASPRRAGGRHNANHRAKRRRHRRRSRHARRPFSRSALSGPELFPHPARHSQRRGAGQRQAHAAEEPAGGGADGAHSAAAARSAEAARARQRSRREDPRVPQIDHALR